MSEKGCSQAIQVLGALTSFAKTLFHYLWRPLGLCTSLGDQHPRSISNVHATQRQPGSCPKLVTVWHNRYMWIISTETLHAMSPCSCGHLHWKPPEISVFFKPRTFRSCWKGEGRDNDMCSRKSKMCCAAMQKF